MNYIALLFFSKEIIIMKSWDDLLIGKFALRFMDDSIDEVTIEQYGVDSKGGINFLVTDEGVILNWASIVYMRPSHTLQGL